MSKEDKSTNPLLLIIPFVVLYGLVYSNYYFQKFGFNSRDFAFSELQIVYFSTWKIFKTFWFWGIIFVVLLLPVVKEILLAKYKNNIHVLSVAFVESLLIIGTSLMIFSLARFSAKEDARNDISKHSSKLPKIDLIEFKNDTIKTYEEKDDFRLLMSTTSYLIIFEVVEDDFTIPILKVFNQSEIKRFQLINERIK